MVGDGTWLSMGEIVALYREAGYSESESTIRNEIDDGIAAGAIESYRTRGQFRRVRASDVRAFIAVKAMPPGEERDRELRKRREQEQES